MNYSAAIEESIPPSIQTALADLTGAYEITSQNSEGGNGYVFLVKNRLLETRNVIKFYGWEGEKKYHLEPQALTAFNSPNVLKVLEAKIVDQSWAYFVTPYCSEGSLDSLLTAGKIGLHRVFDICSGVLTGLTYLHGKRSFIATLSPGTSISMTEGL